MVTMFDNIEAGSIPASAQACAGYVGGRWPDWFAMVKRFPHLAASERVVSIAINTSETARILDVEPGDATPAEAGAWVKRMLSQNVWKPGVYADKSRMSAVRMALAEAGLHRDQYVLWIADWTYQPHLPTGYEACQWTDKSGPNDVSLCLDSFFPSQPQPHPHPHPEGLASFAGHFDLHSGAWQVHGTPGNVTFGDNERWASSELQVCVGGARRGEWRVRPLPWNAAPLGS